jgi:hypothetical protein
VGRLNRDQGGEIRITAPEAIMALSADQLRHLRGALGGKLDQAASRAMIEGL